MAIGVKVPILSELNSKGFKAAYAEFKKLENNTQRMAYLSKKAFSPAGLTAMAGAASAAAYAIWDMANAAADDQKSQAILATALKNTVGATDAQVASTEALITQMQMASGIADTEFRTGFQNLVRATNDVTKSQELLTLATDISVGTGRSLESVTIALARAYTGNYGALTRLGISIDQNAVKSKNFEGVTRDLSNIVGGSATAAAQTYSGQMAITTEKVNEAKESIGAAFIPVLGEFINMAGEAANSAIYLGDAFGYLTKKAQESKWWRALITSIPVIGNMIEDNVAATDEWTGAIKKNYGTSSEWLGAIGAAPTWINDAADAAKNLASGIGSSTQAIEEAEPPLVRYARALRETQAELANTLSGMLNLSDATQNKGVSGFVQGVMGQANQIKNLAKNLTTLGERGLSPMAISGIMSLDLGTAASLAQDLVNSAYSTRMIKNLNRAYGTISTAATQFGQSMGGYMMTGGNAPVTQHITITNPNPKAVVKAIREYGRNSGPIPIAVTGSF